MDSFICFRFRWCSLLGIESLAFVGMCWDMGINIYIRKEYHDIILIS
jgi:hypothetical protein